MRMREAERLIDTYASTAGEVQQALGVLSPLISEANALLDRPGHHRSYGPLPTLLTVGNELTADERDLAWRVDWLRSTDAQPLGVTGEVQDYSPAQPDAKLASSTEQDEQDRSVAATAAALGIPQDYARLLVEELQLGPGEIIVGFGGIDVDRADIRELIEARPADAQFEGLIAALVATAVTQTQLRELEASETSAVRAHQAWVNGEAIDTNGLATHGLELQTAGMEGFGTWYAVRNEQGLTLAAWYEDDGPMNAFGNMTLAEITAEFRRGGALATPQDEIYQGFLNSNDHGETFAAAFAYSVHGDEQMAEQVRLGAWPGNYGGAVSPSAIGDPHIWLDGIGLVPIVGEVADLTNAALYLVEGDVANSAMSVVAIVPFIGSIGPARRVADRLGGELIDSVQLADGTAIHTIRQADGTTRQLVHLTDGQMLGGPSTLVQRQAPEVIRSADGPSNRALHEEYVEGLRQIAAPTRSSMGELIPVRVNDPDADLLAVRLNGEPSVRFEADPRQREFDVVSDAFVGQAKPANFTLNQGFRDQAKATFEFAIATDRQPYFYFDGAPRRGVLEKLQEYAVRYGIEPVIDLTPLR